MLSFERRNLMTRKMVLLMLAMVMTVLSLTLTPKPVFACSGDDCGCGVAAQACIADCDATYAPGTPERVACGQACFQEDVACSRACC
jgi:hypothetical protein